MQRLTFHTYLLLAITFAGLHADSDSMPPRNPLEINYHDAFDQTAIYKQFQHLMQQWGCARNVFDEPDLSEHIPVTRTMMNSDEEQQYFQACFKQLQSTRRWKITEPARESFTFILLNVVAASILIKMLNTESTGGSFGIFASLFNSVYLLHHATRSLFTLAYPPKDSLCSLEERFAKNQCFIPKPLWPIIIEKFMLARLNQFEQRQSMQFIEFALGLTTYKPKPALRLKNEIDLDDGMQWLFEKIDRFFDDYKDSPDNKKYLWMLKHNVFTFVNALQGNSNDTLAPRYLYLYGPGGVGKTYFIHQLCDWINELIPNGVHFEDITITTADELEGTSTKPGAFLRIFRNQLMANKRGSVVFIDEATWLNDSSMVSTAKRVFNGDQSKMSTTYFGSGVNGNGITITAPPMLIFVACNETIKDAPLHSRFDIIQFPMPTTQALLRHAQEVCALNPMLNQVHTTLEIATIEQWINENKIDNFRDIAAQIVPFTLSHKTE